MEGLFFGSADMVSSGVSPAALSRGLDMHHMVHSVRSDFSTRIMILFIYEGKLGTMLMHICRLSQIQSLESVFC